LLRCPTERILQLADEDVCIAVRERLGAPRCAEGPCPRRFASGRVCRFGLRKGWHAHCCPGTAGARTRFRHNPLAAEFCHMLSSAGKFVRMEQRDPLMGPNARLDVVELAGPAGGPAAYDVSVVTAFRLDVGFLGQCARVPGHAAAARHAYKLSTQYADRLPGARLVPLVVETGGRWHPSVPSLVRRVARAYVQRTPGLPEYAVAAVVSRWAARLSALLIRGNALVVREVVPHVPARRGAGAEGATAMPSHCPEGESAYELLVS